jgi:hypothetical protein
MPDKMRPWSISEYTDKFPLIPYVVGQTIAMRNGVVGPEVERFARYTESRMIAVFNHNQRFRRQMMGQHSREWLYVFAEHWFLAWRDNHPRLWPKVNIDELFEGE